ncbi:hypothetical protein Tco_0149435 [Tanacetum coccineum]
MLGVEGRLIERERVLEISLQKEGDGALARLDELIEPLLFEKEKFIELQHSPTRKLSREKENPARIINWNFFHILGV